MPFIAFLENFQMHGKHFISLLIFSTSSSASSCLLDNALMNCRFFVIIMVSLAISAEAEGSQRFVEHPEETKVIVGQTAVLRCRIENQEGLVTWAKNGFILGTARSLPDFARYSMIGSDELGEYHLQIRNVTIQDDATYQCQATRLAAPTQVSLVARLAVLVPPSNAKLENIGSAITVSEGDERIVSCISEGGKPKPSVHWFIASNRNGMDVIRAWHYSEDTVMINEQMISTVRSQLKYVPKRTEDGHFLVCQVNHEALTTPLLTAVALTVLSIDLDLLQRNFPLFHCLLIPLYIFSEKLSKACIVCFLIIIVEG
ncbi:putative irregular chiasm C-roughest protein [Trichinella spiralis]|uniref:putative irregular chiasm C-roughest protein n=1 Tax=Trichinella spiralis TaxID=6334 RepID=UPI0001EFECEA|nr:putative irregular chiasm C-roughest protein [Trichinella spiralis]